MCCRVCVISLCVRVFVYVSFIYIYIICVIFMYVHSNYAFLIHFFFLLRLLFLQLCLQAPTVFFKLMNDWNNELCWKSQHEKKNVVVCVSWEWGRN